MNEPDFYLASAEGYGMTDPRQAWRWKRLRSETRDDLLLIRVVPPLPAEISESGKALSKIIVAARHEGVSLFPIKQWPVFVHVAEALIADPELRDTIHATEFKGIAWAELYRTEQDARRKIL